MAAGATEGDCRSQSAACNGRGHGSCRPLRRSPGQRRCRRAVNRHTFRPPVCAQVKTKKAQEDADGKETEEQVLYYRRPIPGQPLKNETDCCAELEEERREKKRSAAAAGAA